MNGYFEVDSKGLAAILKRRGQDWGVALLMELVQNAIDQNVTEVDVRVRVDTPREVHIEVEDDDPDGFKDLRDAFTLFAPSTKRADATKRGRFNLGEKLVIAACRRATVHSTSGCLSFEDGCRIVRRTPPRKRGTLFIADVAMTRAEHDAMMETLRRIAPPANLVLRINGVALAPRPVAAEFAVELPTEVDDGEGTLRAVRRKTTVRAYEPLEGETPTLYEMGLPVVELHGDRWCLDVGQRVPVNLERNNVTPAYLRALRVAAANALAEALRPEDATAAWVRDALADSRADPAMVGRAVTLRFGPKALAYDPSDAEANKRATAEGYTVVTGGSLAAGEWANVRKVPGLLAPAGRVFPTPTVYSPDGDPEELVPETEWTIGMRAVAEYARRLHRALLDDQPCHVRFARTPGAFWGANYGKGRLCFNVSTLPRQFFDDVIAAGDITREVDALLLHEFGHAVAMDHLSAEYHRALCALGAALRHTGDLGRAVVAEFSDHAMLLLDELQVNGATVSVVSSVPVTRNRP